MYTLNLFLSLLSRILLPLFLPGALPVAEKPAPVEIIVVEKLQWSPHRRLDWSDFKGAPDAESPHHALTAANLAVNTNCKEGEFSYKVTCIFLPTDSWTKNRKSEKLLEHEQLHFDLTEVHARELRRDLQSLNCGNLKSRLNSTVGNAFARWKAEQQRFDDACEHGLNETEERLWAADISKRLQQLQAYR